MTKLKTNFWGMLDDEYSPQYMESVEGLINNPDSLQKALTALNLNSSKNLYKLATDKKIGPVHQYIKTLPKPQPVIPPPTRYKYVGNLEGFMNGKRIVGTEDELIKKYGTDYKKKAGWGENSKFEAIEDKYLDSSKGDTISFAETFRRRSLPKKQQGGFLSYNTQVQPSAKEDLNIKELTTPTNNFNYLKQFKESKYNFMNLPKEQFDPNKFINMKSGNYLQNAVKFIADEEKFVPNVYMDRPGKKGVATIGHGLTAKKYIDKGTITEEESYAGMMEHIEKEVMPSLKKEPYFDKLNDNQKTALVSYIYNVGSGNFAKSKNLKSALLAGDWQGAAKQIDIGMNDATAPGLRKRRLKEQQLFLS